MECKKALEAADGSLEEAARVLRWKEKRRTQLPPGSRDVSLCPTASEGSGRGALAEVSCETDVTLYNETFRSFAEKAARQILFSGSSDPESLLAEAWYEDPSMTVGDAIREIGQITGEEIRIRRSIRFEAEDGLILARTFSDGRIGVLLDVRASVMNGAAEEALENLAMQIAFQAPGYVSEEEIPADAAAHERALLLEQALRDNKELAEKRRIPEDIIEKTISERLRDHVRGFCLYDQICCWRKDGRQTVREYLDEIAGKKGAVITIRRFVRYQALPGRRR